MSLASRIIRRWKENVSAAGSSTDRFIVQRMIITYRRRIELRGSYWKDGTFVAAGANRAVFQCGDVIQFHTRPSEKSRRQTRSARYAVALAAATRLDEKGHTRFSQ